MMAAGNATALDIHDGGDMRPVTWEDWLKLEVREGDNSIGTVHGPVRVPSVLVLARFDKVPKRRPKFCAKAIWERDGGMCQYTGRKLRRTRGTSTTSCPCHAAVPATGKTACWPTARSTAAKATSCLKRPD
jgi:hypothetical protein